LIDKLNDIYKYAERLRSTAKFYISEGKWINFPFKFNNSFK
jgi:hypothetical protein